LKKILEIQQNDQIDNKLLGRIKPSGQCGYTAAAMLLSSVYDKAKTDEFIVELILTIDKAFIDNKSDVRNGAFLAKYPDYLNAILKKNNIPKKTKFLAHSGTNQDIINAIDKGSPVMCSTMITKDGHYICIIGYDNDRKVWIVNDPFGHYSFADSRYAIIGKNSGSKVEYPYTLLGNAMIASSRIATGGSKSGYRLLWLE
jgi:hypothetical protein